MYDKVIEFIKSSGERIRERAGNIPDIGVRKAFLTEEDLRIEREFGELIETFGQNHRLYAEEEHEAFEEAEDIWSMDPISGTALFVKGLPHYGIVVSHIQKGRIMFAAVYDPSMRELYSAEHGKGAFVNRKKLDPPPLSDTRFPQVMVHISEGWNQSGLVIRFAATLTEFGMHHRLPISIGVGYGYVACGKFDGMIALTKDSFPDFAGSLLVREAGGIFTNREGKSDIQPTDRVFVAAHPNIHANLLEITRAIV